MRVLLLLVLCILSSGCATVGYYGQAVSGQLQVLAARRPIASVLEDPATPPATARKLRVAIAAREFGHTELGLPRSGSYRSFVKLDRPYPMWSVVAAGEFSVEARESCFPFAGCLAYRGFFAKTAARRHAARMASEGWEVTVAPVPAYSTLGWFDDPVYSSMLAWDDATLAEMLFHEQAHERVHTRDDTAFDEAYANTVAREGVRRWLKDPAALEAWQRRRASEQAFVSLLLAVRTDLARVYAQEFDVDRKRGAKRERFAFLGREARALGRRLGDESMFEAWFAQPLNNARLALVATYDDLAPWFDKLLDAEGRDLMRFHARVEMLAGLPKDQRRAALVAAAQSRP